MCEPFVKTVSSVGTNGLSAESPRQDRKVRDGLIHDFDLFMRFADCKKNIE